MSHFAKQPEGGEYEKAPEGVYIARCYEVIDIGTQLVIRQTPKGAKEMEIAQVIIGWELFGEETKEDGTPYTIESTYTNSLWKAANLFKDLTQWRGKPFTEEQLKGFDLFTIVGAYCQIQVTHNESGGTTYANVGSIMQLPKGTAKPEPVNEDIKFDIDEPDVAVFNKLREYYKMKIQGAPEFHAPKGAELLAGTIAGANHSDSADVVITDLPADEPESDEPF